MFPSLDILLECWIEHVYFGLLYVMFIFPVRIFYRGVSGFASDGPCDVQCCGLTTCPLFVGLLFGNLVENESKFDIMENNFFVVLPLSSMKLKGGYTDFTPSVCPSVDRIMSALYLQPYLSDPFNICTSYQAILANSLNLQLWLCLLLTWDPIWLNSMGNHEAVGGIIRTQAF